MMTLPEATAMLGRTPVVVRSMLSDLPEEWWSYRAEPGAWSAYDVLGHLLHGERTDWMPRVRVIVEHGAGQELPTFDREGMRGSADRLADLVDSFATLRERSLRELDGFALDAADLERVGRHPAFGQVTLGQHLATWVAHDLCHAAQMAETMAKRYRDDVGPWRAYLPALDRPELTD